MQVKNKINTSLDQIFYFVLYIGNVNNRFTKNELRLLAKIMELYPDQLSFDNRAKVLEELGVKKAYLSQLTSSLVTKGALLKKGYNFELAIEQHKRVAEKVSQSQKLDILYQLSVN